MKEYSPITFWYSYTVPTKHKWSRATNSLGYFAGIILPGTIEDGHPLGNAPNTISWP